MAGQRLRLPTANQQLQSSAMEGRQRHHTAGQQRLHPIMAGFRRQHHTAAQGRRWGHPTADRRQHSVVGSWQHSMADQQRGHPMAQA